MDPLQIILLHPASLLVQLPESYKECFKQVEGRKSTYIAKGNKSQQESWVEPIIWSSSSRQEELDDSRLEQERAACRRKDVWVRNGQRYKRINNKVGKQKTYGKFRQSVSLQVPLNDCVVSCKRTMLPTIR